MKLTVSIVVALMLAVVGLGGCIGEIVDGSGKLTTESHDLSGFTGIEARDGFELEVTMAEEFSIEITADDNVHEYIVVEKSGDTLVIRLQGTRFYNSVTLRAAVTMPSLYRVELSGGSQADIDGFSSAHDFRVALSGGSQLNGDLDAGDVTLELSGGSQVELSGTADDLVVDGSGGSQFNLDDLPVDDASISLSGGSRANINVSGTLNTELSGGSRVVYDGSPALGDIELSGDSSISKK